MADPKNEIFERFRTSLLNIDPVNFIESNLTLDGRPFRLNGNGYKPFCDIYRYIGVKSLEKDAKPVVLVKGRQVGATTMAAALELFFMTSGLFGNAGRPPIRIMHCFPQLELAYAYTKTKLNTMISTAVPATEANQKKANRTKTVIEVKLDKSIAANDSLQFKQFEGGNHVWIESTGLDGTRIRGRTVDGMLFDEVQDMRGAALGNAIKACAKAQYGRLGDGIQVYFGTPKQSGTEYWKIWRASSQQYYHLGCEKCGEYFPLYTPGSNDWEQIWLHDFIVRCTECGHEQDKRDAAERGKWIAANPDADCKFVGYHINQLYMPEFTKEKVLGEKPENHPINTERAYQNEVLGEFYAGSSSPITVEEIEEKCADVGKKFAKSLGLSNKWRAYLGLDWGEKADLDQLAVGEHGPRQQGQSYSCAVVLITDGPHILNIAYATRLKKNDPAFKKEVVDELFRRFSITLAVGDIGHAGDLTFNLQKEYGERFLASRAVEQIKNHIKFNADLFPKEIQFERNYYIEQMYQTMKNGKIRFPYGDYEKIAWLINHCCSMEIKVTRDRNNELKQRYVKGASPNDGFMALLNAYLAYLYDISDGFDGNPDLVRTNPNERKPILAVVGCVPRMH